MSESLKFKGASGEETSPDLYGGRTFPDENAEIRFLQRLQTANEIQGIKWGPAYFERLQSLENKRKGGLSQEQRDRYNYLTRLRNENNDPWPEELRREFIRLQDLVDRQNRPS